MKLIEERVATLETLLGEFIVHTDVALTRLEREMEDFKDEMSEFKKESEKDRKNMNKQWGELANKMGTMDEDIVSPAVRPVLNNYFKCEPLTKGIRIRRRKGDREIEIDVLAVSEDKVFMIEVRSTPRYNYVDDILEKAERFKEFFPEYNDKELIPIFAGLVFNDDVINYANKKRLYIMAYREWEYMDIINFNEVNKDN
jgi:hypothetical protein